MKISNLIAIAYLLTSTDASKLVEKFPKKFAQMKAHVTEQELEDLKFKLGPEDGKLLDGSESGEKESDMLKKENDKEEIEMDEDQTSSKSGLKTL